MNKCPKCGNYMTFKMVYDALSNGRCVWDCECCGYSTRNETCTCSNRSIINKEIK